MHKWLKGKTCRYYTQVVKRLKYVNNIHKQLKG